ncbi:MAG: DUF6174 domain-containing protein [Gemmatimonadota bacterium]|nr:DUF6174 domain-containing protein [Gemmatimonadota bacterium]
MEQLGLAPGGRRNGGFVMRIIAALTVVVVACHKHVPARNDGVDPVLKDSSAVVPPLTHASIVAFFRDTSVTSVLAAQGQTFRLQTPAQRQSLHALLRRERELWLAAKPRDYRFLLRVACFCPGTRGWLLIEVRSNPPLRAWDKTGKAAAITDWNTVSIDQLYDNLERSADRDAEVQIAFEPRWHFPTYVRTTGAMVPDSWSMTEARALRPF